MQHDHVPAEQTLQPQDFGIGQLFWRVREAVIVADAATGRILLWNPGAELIFGYTEAEALTLNVDVLVPPPYRAQHTRGIARYQETGHGPYLDRGAVLELPALRKDGAEFTIELSLYPAGTATSGARFALAIARDVSERHQRIREQVAHEEAEQARRQLSLLAEASRLLSSTLEFEEVAARIQQLAIPALADWFIVDLLEPGGRIRRLKVVHADPALQTAIDALMERYPPSANLEQHPISRVLRGGQPEFTPEVPPDWMERVAVDADHLRLLQRLGPRSGMVVPLVSGRDVLGAMTFAYGNSGRRYTEADLALAEELGRRTGVALENARLYREAKEAVTVRDRFISIASHELRTPLTALKGQLDLTLRRLQRDVAREQLIDGITTAVRQTDRLNRLINALLDVSRLATGRFSIDRRTTDVVALVARTVEDERQLDPARSIALTVPDQPVDLLLDPDRIEQVLTNLLQNARKYSPAVSPVAVELRIEGDQVRILVRDQGIGIPESDRAHIFEPFHRAANAERSVGGLGLGLFVAHEIVVAHGGSLCAESTSGAGSTFTILLPLAGPPAPV